MPSHDDITDAYPLTLLQSGMLFHSYADGDTPTYHDISAIRLSGRFDEDALRATLAGVIERSDILRSSFDLTRFSKPMQLVHASVQTPLTVEDLRGLDDGEQRRRVAEWTEREKATPFAPTRAPLLTLHVHVFADDDFQLNLSFHHAILDGWSLSLVTSQLITGYDARLAGRPDPATAPVTRFRDYLALEQEALASEESAAYWADVLENTSFTGLPRREDPALASVREARVHEVPLPEGLGEKLRAVAAEARVPVKSVMFASHARVLSLLSGRRRVVTGLVGNGRPETADGDQVVGLFLNTLPLVVDVSATSWLELARRVHAAENGALPHRRYPMAQMLQDLRRPQFFETVVDHRSFRSYDMALDHLAVTGGDFFEQTNFPFTANFGTDPVTGEVRLRINYDAARFTDAWITVVGGHYADALAALVADPHAAVHATALLAPADLDRLFTRWNDTRADWDLDRTLPELLAERTAKHPDRTAVRFGDTALTYGEFNAWANRLAHELRDLGVGPDTLVGVHLERSVELIVALTAVLKAGGAYVPLDPGYPRERLEYMLDDARVPVLLNGSGLTAPAAPEGTTVIEVNRSVAAGRPDADPLPTAGPEHLAYTIYTSGSTGRPKGVQIPHRALLNLLRSFGRDLELTEDDRLLAVTSLSFDIAGLEVYLPLLTGAELIVAPDIAVDGPRLKEAVERSGASVIQATPSSWRLLVEAGLGADERLRVVSGGEALPEDLARELTARFPVVWNAYGPTETTIWSCLDRVLPGEPVTLGRPIARTRVYVLDEAFAPVPEGVPGDLYIAGDGLARGYSGRGDLTADRFVPDPYAGGAGARMYRTGDVARWLPDGRLEFLGRSDHQVKVRGFRIELGEIESVLSRHPEVGRVVVVARRDQPGDARLAAYLTPEAGAAPAAADLRALAAGALPEYMVPSAFVVLDAFPLTPNGKVDRLALPAPGREETTAGAFVAPRTPTEEALATIWQDVLGVGKVGVTDAFLELGGNSISALRVIMRLPEITDVEVPVAALFEGGTIERLAAIVSGERQQAASTLVPLRSTGTEAPFFLVHPLGGSVFCYSELVDVLDPDRPLYAFQAPEYAGPDVPRPDSVEEIAALYLSEVRAVQPEGPYHLGGWCMGGMVSYEMARQLEAAGEEVAMLTIISASIDDPVPPRYATSESAAILGAFAGRIDVTEAELEALDPEARLEHVVRLTQGTGHERADARSVEDLRRLVRLYTRHARALLTYRDTPREPLRGDAVLIRAETELFEGWHMGWQPRVGGTLLIDESPGNHFSMLEQPNVPEVARRLEDAAAGRPRGVVAES
ncbi:non-ribosomal peptide synthetase [Streptomyces rishiriensis]|uniref:Amino acid adenylation domain-containing protein n=1 Tax=Streptomyces rishiriensis TaxID=68264 RepID=A0ABU0NUM3_STRRH|nr:amino acid adenylation domain-containing protein [Streptomyces rishiriensis]MDQ0582413.1 amino acid adenylation domain-containing protein [Streptomyces rishiriensis]